MDYQVSGEEFTVRIYENDKLSEAVDELNNKYLGPYSPEKNRNYRRELAEILAQILLYEFDDSRLNYIEVMPARRKTVRDKDM